ncbi:MAG: hypothetical protein K6F57_03590 [Candidatus Saccharibacteria bacterium]|nr:hypothetical protein [Candidatus Saccharibacteria bacterium]
MLQKLRALRTNENVLIAVDILLHSKSAFMSVFLMAFMIRTSLQDSPSSFLVYSIVRYSLMGILSIALLNLTRKHTLIAWRMSMFFSVFQIACVILLDSTAAYFPFVIAVFSALESVLYWRPKMYFDTTEVSDERRLRFKAVGQTWIELAKIAMPIILGVIIVNSSYVHTANIILVISIFQLLLSILFRPSVPHRHAKKHSLMDVAQFMLRHDSMHKIIYLSLLRGIIVSSAGYLFVSQINVYRSANSDLDLGIYTALASFVSIVVLWIYRRIDHHKYLQKTMLFSLLPPAILLPLVAILIPNNPTIAIVFYVYVQSIIESFYNSTLTITRLQDILSRHVKDETYHVEVESFAEVFLSIGRVVTISIVLALINLGFDNLLLPFAFLSSFAIFPVIYLTLPSKMWRHDKIES